MNKRDLANRLAKMHKGRGKPTLQVIAFGKPFRPGYTISIRASRRVFRNHFVRGGFSCDLYLCDARSRVNAEKKAAQVLGWLKAISEAA